MDINNPSTSPAAVGLTFTALTRVFMDNGVQLRDPMPGANVEQAVRILANTGRPHLARAEVRGPEQQGDLLVYTLHRQVGTKGALAGMSASNTRKKIKHMVASQVALRSYGEAGWLPTVSDVTLRAACRIVDNRGVNHLALPSDSIPWVC